MRSSPARAVAVLLAFTALPAWAAEFEVNSQISAVTVYPDGTALVTRSGQVRVPAGFHSLLLTALPGTYEEGSLQIGGQGGGVRIGGVEVARIPAAEASAPLEREIRQRLQALEDQAKGLDDQHAALATRLKFIENLAQLPAGGGEGGSSVPATPEKWSAMWRTIGDGAATTRADQRKVEQQKREVLKQIEVEKRRLAELESGRQEVYRPRVQVQASGDTTATVELSYRVAGAHWSPAYEARLDSDKKQVLLLQQAAVQQATGEDWSGVRLTLSTSRPVRGNPPPVLEPWWVGFVQPYADVQLREQVRAAPAPSAAMSRAGVAAQKAEVVLDTFGASYRVPGQVSLAADNIAQRYEIQRRQLSAALSVQVMPQLDTNAWVFAEATLDGQEALPGGELVRFRDGQYLGEGRLDDWQSGEKLKLNFGADPAIKVEYRPLKDERGNSGIIGQKRTLTRRFALDVTNSHSIAMPVTVQYRIPVARDEDISVRLADGTPAPAAKDVEQRPGVLEWRWTAEPGKKRSLPIGYTVEYPKDKTLEGL